MDNSLANFLRQWNSVQTPQAPQTLGAALMQQQPALMNPTIANQGALYRANMTPPTSVTDPRWPDYAKYQRQADAIDALSALPGPTEVLGGIKTLAAALKGGGMMQALPVGAGMLRGIDKLGTLSEDQLRAVNMGQGMLTKKERKGLFDPDLQTPISQQLGAIGNLNAEIENVRKERQANSIGKDELILRQHQRGLIGDKGNIGDALAVINFGGTIGQGYESAFRANQFAKNQEAQLIREAKAQKPFNDPMSDYWRKDFADSIRSYAKYDMPWRDEANLASLEAIVRTAKKDGWTVQHTSNNGRASSRYLVSPDGTRTVRVSDHELPMTQQREYNHSQGLTGRWNDEIIINNHSTMDEYMRRLRGE